MGLLGNVAEVTALRPKLMTKEFVEEFNFLLDSCRDGIEVSYNAAGVLAHMASDGPGAWTIQHPDRCRVLCVEPRITAVSAGCTCSPAWLGPSTGGTLSPTGTSTTGPSPPSSSLRVKCPMIISNDGLLNDPVSVAGVSHTPECQMWAVWALANLTSVTPDKYCRWLSAISIILPTVRMPSWLFFFQTGAR